MSQTRLGTAADQGVFFKKLAKIYTPLIHTNPKATL